MTSFLRREQAPIPHEAWKELEDEARRVLDVAMHGVREAAGLGARAPHVRQAERERLVETAVLHDDAAGDDDQRTISRVSSRGGRFTSSACHHSRSSLTARPARVAASRKSDT